MKQIDIQVRMETVQDVAALAEAYHALPTVQHPVEVDGEAGWHRILMNVPNDQVGPLMAALEDTVGEAEIVIPASGNIPVKTPLHDVRDRVEDVSSRSTLELVLDVLQSVGSWKGMLLYAAVSGLVAAYGVVFNLPFLLTAAMLIAPLGAPAMVCVVGVALGDLWMLRRGALRFFVSIAVLAIAAAALGLAYGLTDSTEMMETLTNLSAWSALLGVAGGAAGAQALIQAERDSMVTATATGFLVAVSLSPPSAVLGLAAAMGRWDYVALMVFLLALTFTGIIFGGWAALRLRGVRSEKASAGRGSSTTAVGLVVITIALLLGLMGWQRQRGTNYHKADRVRLASELVRDVVDELPGFRLVQVDARFTTGASQWHPGEGLLLNVVVVQHDVRGETGSEGGSDPSAGGPGSGEARLRSAIAQRISTRMEQVHPFVQLSILP